MVDADSNLHHGTVDDDHIRTWVSFDIHVREQDHEKRFYFRNDRQGIRDDLQDLGISEKPRIQEEQDYLYRN